MEIVDSVDDLKSSSSTRGIPMPNFEVLGLRSDDIQEFDTERDGILSMAEIPPGDILEGLHKLRIRESEKLKTVLELYDLEIFIRRN